MALPPGPSLKGQVALVAGASRGAGAAIARVLGSKGATVYVTGRSTRDSNSLATSGAGATAARPGCIEATAEAVTERGGRGIALRCDHTNPREVASVVERVAQEAGRIDLLVNAVWGGNERPIEYAPLWELSLEQWDEMMVAGPYAAVVTTRAVAPLMVKQRSGLVVNVSFADAGRYTGHFWYDLAKAALNRAAFGFAQELAPHGVAALALSPGHMRTELVLQAMGTDEQRWRSVPELAGSESPEYLGAAVAALAADQKGALARSGQVLLVASLAREYGLMDVDGTQPGPFKLP